MKIRNEMVSLMRMCTRWLCSFNIMRRILPEFGAGTRTRLATFFVRTIATVLFIIAPPVDWNASFIVTLKRTSIAVEAWWGKTVKTRKNKSVSRLFQYAQYNLVPRVSLPQENAGNEIVPGIYLTETTNSRGISLKFLPFPAPSPSVSNPQTFSTNNSYPRRVDNERGDWT